jgi:thiamine-phosphate diphosphorylase
MRPVICLITPPRAPGAAARRALVDRIGAAARAGVHLVQIRQPDLDGGALARLVEESRAAVGGTRARVLVNDRLDVALAAGADGVHLRGDSMPAARVRAVAPAGFLIGRSVHSANEARAVAQDGSLDYVIFGTVFATASKPGATVAGPEGLAAACEDVPIPVLAVGGITPERLGAVAAAGADGFAAIGLFATGALEDLPEVIRRAVRAFDTPAAVP